MNYYLKLLLALCLCLCRSTLYPQAIVSAGGDYHYNNTGSISYTIGEILTETLSTTNNFLTQGFHQTTSVVIPVNELAGFENEISVFPNPVKNKVILKIPEEKIKGVQYRLYDIYGKLLQNKRVVNSEMEISFTSLSSATYFIEIVKGKKVIKVFKIVKQ